MWRTVALCSLVGCFHPSPVAGIPCSEGLHCPGDQVCDTSQEPPICVEHLGDAGADATDSPGGGDDAPDGPSATGCTADSECPGGVCHELTGQCIDESLVVFVAPGGADINPCTRASPCASPSNAFNRLTATKRTIAIADGTYTGSILQLRAMGNGGGAPVLISGADSDADGAVLKMSINIDGIDATIEGVTLQDAGQYGIQNKNTATLSRVLVSSASGDCVSQRGGKLTILDSKLDGCDQLGINSSAEIDVERTIITNNKGGGLGVLAKATIVNSVIAKNGTQLMSSTGGVTFAPSGQQVVFRFNTVAGNMVGGPANIASGVECTQPALIEDSIIANNSALIAPQLGANCTAKYSLFDSNAPPGTGNVNGFPLFVNPPTDYHVMTGSPAIDKADPAATETVDFEGGHRPTGAARDIGADEQP